MNELRTLRRLRPEIEPIDAADFERIWGEITGTHVARHDSARDAEPDVAPLFDLAAAPYASGRRRVLTAAAAVLVVAGVGALVAARSLDGGTDQPAPVAQPPASAAPTDPGTSAPAVTDEPELILPSEAPTDPETSAPTATDEPVLLLPAADIEPTYVQHNAARPHRSRGLVMAPDGSTLSINLFENFWGDLPDYMEQREIGGSIWTTTLEDTYRGYVTVDDCTMLSLNAGPGAVAWGTNAVTLMNSVQFADPITIDLPDGWQMIELGAVGDWYSMSFDPAIEGIPAVTLTQTPGSNAGALLADLAGRPIEAVTINGDPAWQVPLDEDGWTHTIMQNDRGSMMLISNGLTTDAIAQLLTQLAPAPASDWDALYSHREAGKNITTFDPACEPTTLRVSSPSD